MSFLSGCSGLTAIFFPSPPKPEELEKAAEAQRILSSPSDQNDGLKNFKGIGRTIWKNF